MISGCSSSLFDCHRWSLRSSSSMVHHGRLRSVRSIGYDPSPSVYRRLIAESQITGRYNGIEKIELQQRLQ